MSRTKVFVSYSHIDRDWLNLFSMHIAVLERRGLVDLWSDTRIDAGTDWEKEIESALTTAKVAVLLISPSFLASDYIWKNEMPRIVAHSAQGMNVLPLIVRPCAWRLEEDLSRWQARPPDGQPLSLGTDSQVDLELSGVVYELAAQIGKSPAAIGLSSIEAPIDYGAGPAGVWIGYYNGMQPVRLLIEKVDAERIAGSMEYPETGAITNIEGTIYEGKTVNDQLWVQIGVPSLGEVQGIAIRFRETGYESTGTSSIIFDGEYRAIARGDEMTGAWFSGNRLVGAFTLHRSEGRH